MPHIEASCPAMTHVQVHEAPVEGDVVCILHHLGRAVCWRQQGQRVPQRGVADHSLACLHTDSTLDLVQQLRQTSLQQSWGMGGSTAASTLGPAPIAAPR